MRTVGWRQLVFVRLIVVQCLCLLGAGCGSGQKDKAAGDALFGKPVRDPLFAAVQGSWQFVGRHTEAPQATPSGGTIAGGPDLRIDGHIISSLSPLHSTQHLFDAHLHQGRICAKAWHHEDPNDPGDMSKQHLTLAVAGDTLTIRECLATRQVDIDDPDVEGPVRIVREAGCALEGDRDYGWTPWTVLTYTRKR